MIYHNLSILRTENVYATMSLLLPTVVHAPRYVTIKDAVRTTGFNRLVNQMTATSELIVAEE